VRGGFFYVKMAVGQEIEVNSNTNRFSFYFGTAWRYAMSIRIKVLQSKILKIVIKRRNGMKSIEVILVFRTVS
jgi:hypothetical protein